MFFEWTCALKISVTKKGKVNVSYFWMELRLWQVADYLLGAIFSWVSNFAFFYDKKIAKVKTCEYSFSVK